MLCLGHDNPTVNVGIGTEGGAARFSLQRCRCYHNHRVIRATGVRRSKAHAQRGETATMTTQAIKLELDPRELLGKKVRQLRREGIVPVHLYGPGIESRPLQCGAPRLIQVLARAGGNTPVSVTIRGEKENHLAFARRYSGIPAGTTCCTLTCWWRKPTGRSLPRCPSCFPESRREPG